MRAAPQRPAASSTTPVPSHMGAAETAPKPVPAGSTADNGVNG